MRVTGHHHALEPCIATACGLPKLFSLLLVYLLVCLLLMMVLMEPDCIAAQVGVNYDPMMIEHDCHDWH